MISKDFFQWCLHRSITLQKKDATEMLLDFGGLLEDGNNDNMTVGEFKKKHHAIRDEFNRQLKEDEKDK